jgi:hypothetical protein
MAQQGFFIGREAIFRHGERSAAIQKNFANSLDGRAPLAMTN